MNTFLHLRQLYLRTYCTVYLKKIFFLLTDKKEKDGDLILFISSDLLGSKLTGSGLRSDLLRIFKKIHSFAANTKEQKSLGIG
jgi:hypothetical protein